MLLETYRINRLLEEGKKAGVAVLVASTPANIGYLSIGYRSVGQAVSATAQLYVLLDINTSNLLYVSSVAEVPCILEHAGLQAQIFCYGTFHFDVDNSGRNPLAKRTNEILQRRYPNGETALAAALQQMGNPVGIDEGRMNFEIFSKLSKLLPNTQLQAAGNVFMQARQVKHADEIAGLRKSAQIAEAALLEALNGFLPGMTELDLQKRYQVAVVRREGDPYFFVATAADRSAYVDAMNKPTPISKGDVIRFDFGCIVDGYYSDLARTACIGDPDDTLWSAYAAVRRGCERAVQGIRPGVVAQDIFSLAQESVREAGLPDYTRHHCGHGIGLEGYDMPSIAPIQSTILEENMVLCIETPYYRLGWGGVQIENTVVVRKDGAEYLDSGDQRLIIVPCAR